MSSALISRTLVRQRPFQSLQPTRYAQLRSFQPLRHASTKPSNPIVLEKPDRFRPPSHPQRIVKKKPVQYGPRITDAKRTEMKQKQYPHMMPPEGTVMYKFLTTKWIHFFITFGVLISLALFVFIQDFLSTTIYRDLLPHRTEFLSHPIDFMWRWITVYKMHVEHESQKVAAMRQKSYDDVQKQKEYRRAHGITAEPSLVGRMTGIQLGTEGPKDPSGPASEAAEVAVAGLSGTQDGQRLPNDSASHGEYTDFEGKRKKPKKWFGIWE